MSYPDPLPLILPFNGISLLAGAPGVGKTALTATLLLQLRDGRPVFGHQPNSIAGIGVIAADRSWASSHEWYVRAGWPDIPVYSLADDSTLDKKRLRFKHRRIDLLNEFLERLGLPPGSLVCIDPISLFLGGNMNDYDTCMMACLELRDLLRQRQLTALGLAHASKQRADTNDRYLRLQDRILGSTAIFGFSDTQMYLAAPQETGMDHYSFLWAPHLAPAELFALTRDEQGLFIPYDEQLSGNPARVLALFPTDGSPLRFSEVLELAAQIPLSKATLHRCLQALVAEQLLLKHGHGMYSRPRAN